MSASKAFAKLGAAGCTIPKGGVTQENYDQVLVMTPAGLKPSPYAWEEYEQALAEVETDVARAALRDERNKRLAASDFVMFPDVQVQDKEAWVAYRQALRDLPETARPKLLPGTERLDISSVDWPVMPTGA